MKYISLLFLIVILTPAYTQNWSPIQTNEKMNYQHSDSAYIGHTIWVDNIDVTGSDTTFFLNKVVKDHPTDIDKALRNQPQFLYSAMIRHENGIYHFADPGYYILYSQAGLNDTWVFDLDENLMAQVLLLGQEEIFGIMDSIKIISLSDGSEIKLSKSFGFIQFPDFENGGYFELVGIQDSEYGESIPGFWGIYNFEVGDIFQYSEYYQYIYDGFYTTRKYKITSKEVTGSSYNYSIEGLKLVEPVTGPPQSYTLAENLIFTNSDDHPSNYFPGQIYIFPDSVMANSDTIFTATKVVFDNETGLVYKHFGNKEENYTPYETDLFYEQNENNDTLIRLEYASLVEEPCGLMGIGFGENIGDLYRTEGCFEGIQLQSLTGYIKDGDTVGTITPDSLLLTSIKLNESRNQKISVFPNPATDVFNIFLLQENNIDDTFIEIRNIQGALVLQKELTQKEESIDVSKLKPGVYFYTIHHNKANFQRGKILIY